MRFVLVILVLTVIVAFGGAASVILRHDVSGRTVRLPASDADDGTLEKIEKPAIKKESARKIKTVPAPSNDSRVNQAVEEAGENLDGPSTAPKEDRKIFRVYPDISRTDPMQLLGRLAVTEFHPRGEAEFEGGDEQFQNYKYYTQNDEEVVRWDWSDDGNVAVEQINYSPDERVIRRYFDHTGEMSEVSYEYGGRGGLMRYREDGTIESYQTWNGSGSNTLVRYDGGGSTQEVWSLDGTDWKQVF